MRHRLWPSSFGLALCISIWSSVGPAAPVGAAGPLGPSMARADALTLIPVKAGQLRIDGDVGEWRGAPFKRLGDEDDCAIEYALGYDASALYVGARVSDDALTRSGHPGVREDAVVLTLGMPRPGGALALSEVWLYAGEMGRSKASASVAQGGGKPKRESGIEIVEGPLAAGPGYVLEARIPWKVVARGGEHQLGHGALRLHDVDGGVGARASTLASGPLERKRLPALHVEGGANGALAAFMHQKGLSPGAMRRNLYGDVFGDARLERVVVASTFAVVVGPDIQGGEGFHYIDLPVTAGAGVREATLVDLTADGKAELTVRLAQQNALGKREVFNVMALDRPQARRIFSLELRKETSAGAVEAKLRIGKASGSRAPAIDVRIGEARGLGPEDLRESRVQGVEPILLPWGEVAQRVYRWDGSRFAIEREDPNPDAQTPASGLAQVRKSTAEAGSPGVASHAEPPGVDQLVAAFRQAQGIPRSERARFERHVNVAEDGRVESLMLFGAHLLVVGEGYRGGTGYFYFRLPVPEATDIQRLFTGDVTGDGRREVFVRFKQRVGDVQREILLGYTFDAEGAMQQILALEVRREHAGDAIGNVVDLVRSRGHWALRVKPGRARGWTADSYPFVQDSGDGYGPLLLPWSERATTYRFDGRKLVR